MANPSHSENYQAIADVDGRTAAVLAGIHHRQLEDLRHHWSTAYWIAQSDGDTWVAAPLADPAHLITADTAAELRELIRQNYFRHDRRHMADLS